MNPPRANFIYRLTLIISVTLLLGFIGAAIISPKAPTDPVTITGTGINGFLGSSSCAGCHTEAYQNWQGSHHDQAMQYATAATVKGDFNNGSFEAPGNSALFTTKADGFYARLAGKDGQVKDYKILYTFGTEPLQQYLVAFPNGRLQQLPVAWNTLTNQWFDPQPELLAQPGEWVHWSEGGKNWNSMCADCHSNNVEKNFDIASNSYKTSVSEIDVGCESCHGPGSNHVDTVSSANFNAALDPLHINMKVGEDSQVVVDQCGRCHARRQQLTTKFEQGSNQLLDHYLPQLLTPPTYHSDGQILDEVFVYGSFVQSKMYHSGIGCLDCHQPHSVKLKAEGNQLCVGCHSSELFDTPTHHQHGMEGALSTAKNDQAQGTQCIDCHMPGRLYMGNDYRRDHSFRIPRPDLSVDHGTPNACNDCHSKESAEWAAAKIAEWFGPERPAHFSEILTAAASQPNDSVEPLVSLLKDLSQPAIARATAASLLAPDISLPMVERALTSASNDASPLLRTTSVRSLNGSANKVSPLLERLNDPVRAVRIAAAEGLVDVPQDLIPNALKDAFSRANKEHQTAMLVNADFPSGRMRIAIDQHLRGNLDSAAEAYLAVLKIDSGFNAARMNLAQLYYSQGKTEATEELYRTVIEREPQASEAHYSLGLLMAEQARYEQAALSLESAATTGNNPRAWYNLAVLNQQSGKSLEAEKAYLAALQLMPGNAEFINGLVSLYGQQQRWLKALQLIDRALVIDPTNPNLQQLKRAITQRI
ncbi:MAG: tetratricopeptide repeat protein [Porticoccaceae bacterium]|nr:tetratricopeptide repeat protein [Porticoccaceae bacterium]